MGVKAIPSTAAAVKNTSDYLLVITEFDCIKKYVFLKYELANFYKNKAQNVLVKLTASDKKQRRQPSVSQQRFFGERQTTTKKMEKCFFLQKK